MSDASGLNTSQEPLVWYHLVLTVYGAWLPGDPRGFRTRHHREHVEGDYKNPPPPGKYANLERRSRAALKQPPVVLSQQWRAIVGSAIVERLQQLGALVLCAAVASQHLHALAKMPQGRPREWAGLAKLHAWHVARSHGWKTKLWALRGKETRIFTRQHQLNAYYYILKHAEHGAWTWQPPGQTRERQ